MRQVHAVLFNSEERETVHRAHRWVGIHPEADEESARSKRAADVRTEVASYINSVAQGTEPVFGERLDRLRDMLTEMGSAAWEQSFIDYWMSRGTTGDQAQVLATAREEAHEDIRAALAVLDEGRQYTEDVRPYMHVDRYGSEED